MPSTTTPRPALAASFTKSIALDNSPALLLLPPIDLPQPSHRRSQFHEACLTKRQPKPTPRSRRNRRPLQHAAAHSQSPQPDPFDSLPWISILNAPPKFNNTEDIADLSLIPALILSTGPGPTRRRRSPSRSVPFSSLDPRPSQHLYPILRPETPRSLPRVHPSRILFHQLMPVTLVESHPTPFIGDPCSLA